MEYIKRYRLYLFSILCVIIPLGFGCKIFTGPFQFWVRNSLGGVFYEIFWCFVIAFVFTKISPARIAVRVFAGTALLEIMQLWHPGFLEMIRSTFIGRTLIGTSFVWSDFFYYLVGCAAGVILLRMVPNK